MKGPAQVSRDVARLVAGDVARLVSGAAPMPTPEELLQFRFRPGDRVVLLDTGEVAEVIRASRVNVVVPTP